MTDHDEATRRLRAWGEPFLVLLQHDSTGGPYFQGRGRVRWGGPADPESLRVACDDARTANLVREILGATRDPGPLPVWRVPASELGALVEVLQLHREGRVGGHVVRSAPDAPAWQDPRRVRRRG